MLFEEEMRKGVMMNPKQYCHMDSYVEKKKKKWGKQEF